MYITTGKMDAQVVWQRNQNCPGGSRSGCPQWNNKRQAGASPWRHIQTCSSLAT